ncbi:MAG TPA: thiamine pyrophosphate-dependent enzyme [Vicinamibacterales bacterium]|nr:thiamine pyrophosphate-dependent enzyme [Vicinamibacterales bacterium]
MPQICEEQPRSPLGVAWETTSAVFDRDAYGKPVLPLEPAAIFRFGHLIRLTEQLLLDLFSKGLLSGTTHTCLGQELCQMSVVRALDDPDDVVLSNHRNHGHFLTYSGAFEGLVCEIMGRETGVCGGVGGSQHLAFRHFHSNGVQAGMTAIGTGLALARRMRRSNAIVSCVVGDGTLGEGLLYESLNLASVWGVPMLFVVEHNGIAQTTPTAHTIGGSILARGEAFGIRTWELDDRRPDFLESAEAVVRTVREKREPGYLVIHTARLGPHSKGDDLRDADELDAIRARDPLARLGDAIDAATRAEIEARNHLFIQHVQTRALQARESMYDSARRHIFGVSVGASTRMVSTRRPAAPAPKNVRASLNEALRRLLETRPDVLVLGEDLHDPYGGAFKVTAGLSSAFRDRVISTPISEAGVVGAAIGLALAGFRPIVEIMFADFISLAMDQIYNHAVKFPGMFPDCEVPLLIRTPAGGRRGYGPTHSQSPENLLTAVPGLTVLSPSHRHDSGALLTAAATDWRYPVAFVEHKLLYGEPQDRGDYQTLNADAADAGANVFETIARRRERPDMTLVAYGGMLPVVERAAAALEAEEYVVEIVSPSMLQPFPRRTLLAALHDAPRVAIVEESPFGPGFGSELSAALAESRFAGRVTRIAPPPVPIPAARSLEAQILLDERGLFDALVPFMTGAGDPM